MTDENRHQTITQKLDALKRLTKKGKEYWRATEIMPILGYSSWRRMKGTIERAMGSFEAFGEDPSHHFAATVKVDVSHSGPDGGDFFLSRPACYITVMNGDSRKPEVAEAQQYFAVQTRGMEQIEQLGADLKRIEMRDRLTENTKLLGDAAKDAGVENYGLFHGAGIKAMYSMRLSEIKAQRNIVGKENWLDRMGSEELAANDFRLTQTEAKLRREGVSSERNAINAHATVGKEVRELIDRVGNTLPENLPVEEPIKVVSKRARSSLPKAD